MINKTKHYLDIDTDSSPLAVFRIGFGLLMLYSMIRFWSKGWIDKVYIQPKFHFKYYGFEWIQGLGEYTYLLFAICIFSAILITIGYKYQLSITVFFLSFTYIELLEKTIYLNHYYFISILSFLLIFLPLSSSFSVDNLIRKEKQIRVPKWTIDCLKLLLFIVYFFAGLAKINSDWLLDAMPLKIWLPSKYDIPFIGENLMQKEWVHYLMSWGGMLYDLAIPFLLIIKRTRLFGFVLVVIFHLFTRILFPIGVFPYIMIISALIFFDSSFHNKIINYIKKIISYFTNRKYNLRSVQTVNFNANKFKISCLTVFFILQFIIPLRYFMYDGNLLWHEQGYRFSWRVMLMEKTGYTTFKIVNKENGEYFYIDNEDHLTSYQEKQMGFQPDFILEYAHYLGGKYEELGYENIEIFADSYVALNGRASQRYIDPEVNLLQEKESFRNKTWILPLKDE
jgi:hypothetical protein